MHFYYDVDEWELYDLEADQEEMNNVYGQEGYEEITAELKEEMKKLQEKYKEPDELIKSFLPEE